ncbi:MAG: glycosyltransferase 61 family protein, partial [bacterium]
MLAGYPPGRQVKIGPSEAVLFRELYVPTMLAAVHPESPGFVVPAFLPEFLRQTALKAAPPASSPVASRRIYLPRQSARWRRVINETEILGLLRKFQFEVV